MEKKFSPRWKSWKSCVQNEFNIEINIVVVVAYLFNIVCLSDIATMISLGITCCVIYFLF